MMDPRFLDRREAGRALAARLTRYAERSDVVVLALPRGGVPVAFEVATALSAPLDVFVVRKLGLPGHEELAMGAIASGGVRVLNDDVVKPLRIPPSVIERVTAAEAVELRRREVLYRRGDDPVRVDGKVAILVDDGLATGSTMKAAVQALRRRAPARIVVAVPVGAPSTCDEFAALVDDVVCAITPELLDGVGYWYADFSQTGDAEVVDLLRVARERETAAS